MQIWSKFDIAWSTLKIVFKHFANTLTAPPTDCFWQSIYCFTKKMHVSEYACKICHKEYAIFKKYKETFNKNAALPTGIF